MGKFDVEMRGLALILLFMFAVWSCTSPADGELCRAEGLMEEHPDSALVLLEGIGSSSLTTDGSRALYALLLTQARDKNYIDETDDSLISVAVDYYAKENEANRLSQALFQKAQIQYNSGRYIESLTTILSAEDNICDTADYFLKAKIYELFSEIYYDNYCKDLAITYQKKAIENFELCGRNVHAYFGNIVLSFAYFNKNDNDSSIIVLDKCAERYPMDDSLYMAYLHEAYILPLLRKGKMNEAFERYEEANKYWGANRDAYQNFGVVAEMHLNANNPDSAMYYLEKYKSLTSVFDSERYYRLSANYNEIVGNEKDALSNYKKVLSISSEKESKAFSNNVSHAAERYFSEKAYLEQVKNEKYKYAIIGVVLLFTVIAVLYVIFHKYKIRQKKEEINQKIYDILDLSQRLVEKEALADNLNIMLKSSRTRLDDMATQISEQENLIGVLFKERFNEIDKLSQEFFRVSKVESLRKNIVSEFEKVIMSFNDDETKKRLYSIINRCKNDVLVKMREQFPKFKENDVFFLSLIIAGFSQRAICVIMDLTYGNYYNKWSRLRERISESDSRDKDYILSVIERRD